MKKYKHEELFRNDSQNNFLGIEIAHDILEAEQEYDDIGISDRLRNKLRNGIGTGR